MIQKYGKKFQDSEANNPPIAGGCPLLNVAIESTDVFPELHAAAAKRYDNTVVLTESLIKEEIEKKEIKDDIDAMSLASFLSSSMEGAIMASRVSKNNIHHHYFIHGLYIKTKRHFEVSFFNMSIVIIDVLKQIKYPITKNKGLGAVFIIKVSFLINAMIPSDPHSLLQLVTRCMRRYHRSLDR